MNTESVLLSVSEAKKQLGVSSQSIRRFISEGQLIGEKTDTGRWAVESESVQQLLARRKSQQNKPKQATPNATPVASNVAPSVLKRPPQASDVAKYRSYLRPVLSERGVTWLDADELVALFHNTILDYTRADQFQLSVVVDWSNLFDTLYLISTSYGSLSVIDPRLIDKLMNPPNIFELSDLDMNLCDDVLGVIGSAQDWECDLVRYIQIYYNSALVCRSAPESQLTLLVA